jgi:hypothetical protein
VTAAQINEKIAVWLTAKIGSMWAGYLFCLIAFISAPAALASGNSLVIVAWIAQTFLQLVLLPVIMVGQDVQGRRTETTILDTHELAVSEHEQTRILVEQIAASHEDLQQLLTDMHQVLVTVHATVVTVTVPEPGE